MMQEISVKAFAKVNFGLAVLPKRNDGFHCIESIFQTVDLSDELVIKRSEKKGCFVTCDSMKLPEVNTITAAYKALGQVLESELFGVEVFIKKGIPSGGGLGGGSSDAAAFIRGMELLGDFRLSDEKKDYIADKTGSDVFFFMHCDDKGSGCALVSGRGEVVKQIQPRKDLWLVMIFPGVHSSTKEAYSLVDDAFEKGRKIKSPDFSEYEFIYNKSVQDWTFINTFTPVISDKYEKIRNAIGALEKTNCCYAEMSGSGATVFGVFTSKQQADFAYNSLAETWCCKLVSTI
ncbi:4-diphosphocytidyl-2C-methyl-D-erythritol kinase [Treponema sp. JC4]|uniref:4-(cytidine 5'-diphospho)-2-C-methyl-D-erythritol kinase n=1 Tax=Treponema sp. JC4 TaxID=1124982 RepID=UPI00025B0C07|nr:4-(cytidine 5'-diphospho)-2-C-methyl-D-erythritol kinase [Treponema sp. JC4]EID85584.1 4-diphosphocytidyl-2C-methyl-D-erythritol kinase [Treponema sp. JC4]